MGTITEKLIFKGDAPCNNCPYRKDAPKQHWDKEEFEKLIKNDRDYMGKVYGCHKNNGTVCRGWLMDQDERGLPSMNLRMSLIKNNITREYLDKLHCPGGRFKSIRQMCIANYPDLAKEKNK